MRIHVYGCSWSQGQPHINNFDNWPKQLALLEPSWKIYNFSYAGSSIHFSSALIMHLSKKINEPTYHIFQGTTAWRWTYMPKIIDPMQYLKKELSNYWGLWLDRESHAITYQPKLRDKGPVEIRKFYKSRLKIIPTIESELEFSNTFEAIRNNFNLTFFQTFGGYSTYKKYYDHNVLCIEEVLGDDLFHKYIVDKGAHFGEEGLKWQAKYIRNLITG